MVYSAFNEAKTKIAKLLFSTVGLCYQIVPIDLRTGSNVMPESVKYEWFSGPSLKQLLMEDQVRTNFDEKAYKELCEEPFKMLLLDCYLVPGVGTVPEGLVVSGRLKIDDTVRIYPHGKNLNLLNDFETYHYRLPDASPGKNLLKIVMGFFLLIFCVKAMLLHSIFEIFTNEKSAEDLLTLSRPAKVPRLIARWLFGQTLS